MCRVPGAARDIFQGERSHWWAQMMVFCVSEKQYKEAPKRGQFSSWAQSHLILLAGLQQAVHSLSLTSLQLGSDFLRK